MGASGDTTTVPSGASLVVASGATINITGATQTGFPSSGFVREVVYTSSTSTGGYSPNADVTKIIVEVLGGGGGGSNYSADGPKVNSGAGGGYVRKTLTVVSSDTMTVNIGVLGPAGGANSAGGNGGDTTFVTESGTSFTTLTGGGGGGGSVTNYTPGVSGTATGGDFNIVGAPGRTHNAPGADGGDSPYGYGGSPNTTAITIPIAHGTGYGSGGGGAADSGSSGTGAPGLCIITEYK
jgi:hypothetical protein